MSISSCSVEFINAMVQAMYQFEAHQVRSEGLLTRKEEMDFYWAYMGC